MNDIKPTKHTIKDYNELSKKNVKDVNLANDIELLNDIK